MSTAAEATTRKARPVRERSWPTYLALTLLAVFFLFPLVMMLASAFKQDAAILPDSNSLKAFIPNPFDGTNFQDAADRADMWILARNSAIISIVCIRIAGIRIAGQWASRVCRSRASGRPRRGRGR